MTKPYSMDFREKAIARVEAGESRRSVARGLGVSPSAIVKWDQRKRDTGSVAPAQIGGYAPKKIRGEHADWLEARLRGGEHFTLRGLVAELAARGLKVDYRTMWSFVRDRRLSWKKNRGRGGAK